VAEEHCDHLGLTGEAFCPSLCLVFVDELSKFCAGKMMKQLTKQTCYRYHVPALSCGCEEDFSSKKFYITITVEGIP
jgi:hypothetical protein